MRLPLPTWFIVCFVLPACSFDYSCGGIDMSKVKDSVRETLAGVDIEATEINCPEKAKLEVGGTFECRVKFKTAEFEGVVNVVQKDDQGNIEWNLINGIVTSKVEADMVEQIKKQTKIDATVDCGARVHQIVKDKGFECMVKSATESKKFAVTFTDDKGGYSWKVAE